MRVLHRTSPVEAPPQCPRAVPASPPPPLPLGAPARAVNVLFGLRLEDGTLDTAPLAQADWSARIAADFGAVNSALIWLASNTQRCIEQAANAEVCAVRWLLAALADFAAEVDDDRGALYGHVNTERVLITEAVAL